MRRSAGPAGGRTLVLSTGTFTNFEGGSVVVGAPYDDTGADGAGAAYLFDAATGTLLRTLSDPTSARWLTRSAWTTSALPPG